MKLKKLMLKVEGFLDADERARKEQMSSMHEVLDALKRKERRLRVKIRAEKDPETKAGLEKKCEVAHAQRKKGLIALKALQKA